MLNAIVEIESILGEKRIEFELYERALKTKRCRMQYRNHR